MGKGKFSRPRKIREIGAKVIIVCEGETEEIYFEAIRKSKRLQTLKIRVVNPDFTDPENIVKYAVEIRDREKKEKNWLTEDQIWAVYDGDEHKAVNINNWKNAINLANEQDINLGISNPSFELWYLLHYQEQNAAIDRHETFRKLKTHLPYYHKTKDLYQKDFEPFTYLASEKASKLSERIEKDFLEKYSNPSTEIYLLVKRLFEL
ncbi:MAG: RloB family protein [Pyrinomonadaceae bacterium]|nr:RloB family protein [Pyrinomonadaceae bacterium]